MGGCRALNLMLGMTAAPAMAGDRWALAWLPFVYIVAVTGLSRSEVHGGSRTVAALALIGVAAVVTATMGLQLALAAFAALPFAALFAWRVLPPFGRAVGRPEPAAIREAIRAGVLSLVLLDAALAAAFAGPGIGLLVLGLAPVAWGLSRLFAVT
jgi:4-hydroxybenzoate polyprenyltransferase